MFSYFCVVLLLLKTVSTQLNGDFWWLHEKVAKLQQVEPPLPKFDDVSEFETDESVKVVFKDNEIHSKEHSNDNITEIESFLNQGEILPNPIKFQDQSQLLIQPMNFKNTVFKNSNSSNATNFNQVLNEKKGADSNILNKSQSTEDVFEFIFPMSNEIIWENKIKNFTQAVIFNETKSFGTKNNNKPNTIKLNDKVSFEEEKKQFESESICTFIDKHECARRNGLINMPV